MTLELILRSFVEGTVTGIWRQRQQRLELVDHIFLSLLYCYLARQPLINDEGGSVAGKKTLTNSGR